MLLLRQIDAGLGVTEALAGCCETGVTGVSLITLRSSWLAQRIYGLALGYEDLK